MLGLGTILIVTFLSFKSRLVVMWPRECSIEYCKFLVYDPTIGDCKIKRLLTIYTFSKFWLQDELDTVAQTWNSHRIRSTKNQRTPSGRPFVLYSLPELCGADNYLHEVEDIKIQLCEEECRKKAEIPCDRDVYDLCCLEMEDNGWDKPENPNEAIELYLFLRSTIRELVLV